MSHVRSTSLFLFLFACSAAPSSPTGGKPRAEAPAHTVGGFSLTLPERVLAPGEETQPCLIFPLVLVGPSKWVGGAHLSVGVGLHHGNIIARKRSGDGTRACAPGEGSAFSQATDVIEGGTVLFGSSTQLVGDEWQRFSDGMAYEIGDDFEIVARMHYLNATAQPLTVAPRYEWFTIDEVHVRTPLAPFAWDMSDLSLPPRQETTLRAECGLAGPMHLVSVLPHMHALGTAFRAGYIGGARDQELFLDSPGYDPDRGVLVQYEPAVDLSVAEGFTFSCTWNNTFDKEIRYGVGDNEMCTLFGYAYPPEHAYTARVKDGACVTLAAR